MPNTCPCSLNREACPCPTWRTMPKTTLSELTGFTPLPDRLVKRYGIVTASVFGQIWRYCQMKDGICRAAMERIAGELHLSRMTVLRHIKNPVARGFLEDTTPDLRNRPHLYADTGKASMEEGRAGVSESDNEAELDVTESDGRVTLSDSHCNTKLLEDSSKKVIKRGLTTPPAGAASQKRPDFQRLTVQKALGIPELQRFQEATGYFPSAATTRSRPPGWNGLTPPSRSSISRRRILPARVKENREVPACPTQPP